jgi:hypothetical protein
MSGLLAIWNDCTPGREAAYEDWYQGEHLIERLGVPGFRIGRRYEAVAGAQAARRYFTAYEVDGPEVLVSPAYRALLENPSPRTTAIMRDGFINMCRTVCTRHAVRGPIRGGVALTIATTAPDPRARLDAIAAAHPLDAALTHAEIWIALQEPEPPPSAEEALRGRDAKITGGLVLEFLREAPPLRVAAELRRDHDDLDIGVFRLIAALRQEDLA